MDVGRDLMTNPQLENGYTPIANELLEAIYSAEFNATQLKIVLCIMRYTYGFSRKEHGLSISFLATGTGVSKRYIIFELQRLIDSNVVTVVQTQIGTKARILKINKRYTEWDFTKSCQLGVKNSSGEERFRGEELFRSRGEELFRSRGEELFTQDKQNIKQKTSTGGLPKNRGAPVKVAIDYYHDKFVDKFGEKPIIAGKKDGNLMKQLVSTYGIDKVRELLDKFFEVDDEFINQSGYTVGVFFSQANKLLTLKARRATPRHGRL